MCSLSERVDRYLSTHSGLRRLLSISKGILGVILFAWLLSGRNSSGSLGNSEGASLLLAGAALLVHSIKMTPLTRELVVERMHDGWLVLDMDNRIVDLNGAAEKLIGLPAHKIMGQPAESILSDWPSIVQQMGNMKEIDLRGSVEVEGGRRWLGVRLSPLADQDGNYFGKLLVWRDVTEGRAEEQVRQKARDEMFVLLHAISGAASRAMDQDEFLEEANYQVVYSFQSQSSAIFLLPEHPTDESARYRLTTAVEHGMSAAAAQRLAAFLASSSNLVSLLESREPWLIPNIGAEPDIPLGLQQEVDGAFLFVPMVAEGMPVGVMCVSRREGPLYSADDITRLSIVADEVAAFVASDRQRQMATVLAERQRLVRDLHDSVTQRLYGLLRLTEAAQAGLEAGRPAVSEQLLPRIAEHTRQALKEMRLFLYGLQPVDLQHEGLVSVLHQRLAAVEGRADVTTQFLADDKIALPLPKEVALYFIAQEALNNVLRHANAGSVTLRLRQRKSGVQLVIEDDGCGFDPHQVGKGGMGLRNMRERATKAGGHLKLTSAPGKGTRVSVSVPIDIISLPEARRG